MKLRLVDNWRQFWKWGSVQLAAIAGAMVTGIVAAWPFFSWTLTTLFNEHPRAKTAVAALGFVLVTGLPILTRITTTRKE